MYEAQALSLHPLVWQEASLSLRYQLLCFAPSHIQLWEGTAEQGLKLVKTIFHDKPEAVSFVKKLFTPGSVWKNSRKKLESCHKALQALRPHLREFNGPLIFTGCCEELRIFKHLLKGELSSQERLVTTLIDAPLDRLHKKCLKIAKTCERYRMREELMAFGAKASRNLHLISSNAQVLL
jgi:hypothetical protein